MGVVQTQAVGSLLREWRGRRRMSQLALACEAGISTRHLSFLETGRSLPSRDMLLRLAEQLKVPLRERNVLLVAAGYAPLFPERALEDPALHAARRAVELVLNGHEPYPALAVDRRWTLMAYNSAVKRFLRFADPSLLLPPVNVLRVSLHPKGLAPRIVNLSEWRAYLLERLRRQIEITADQGLVELMSELRSYPVTGRAGASARDAEAEYAGVLMPFQVITEEGTLSFFSTTTIFGTPVDVTLSELAIESFLPANAETAEALRRRAQIKDDERMAP